MKIFVSYCVPLLLITTGAMPASAAPEVSELRHDGVIAAVILADVTAFSSEALLSAYADSLGRQRTVAEERTLRDRVATFYTEAGFLRPNVVMTSATETSDTSNIVKLRVVEPTVVEVETVRLTAGQASAIQRQVQALQSLQPVAAGDIESFRRDVEATLDIQLDTSLMPMEDDPAAYRLLVTPRPSVSGELIYTAEGSQSLGRHMAGATMTVATPLPGLSEMYLTALHTVETDGYGNFGFGGTAPITDSGRLQLDFSKARAVPQYEFASEGTRYRRQWTRLQYVHDAVTTREQEIDFYAGLAMRNYEREEFGLVSLDEQLRMVDFGVRSISGSAELAFRFDTGVIFGVEALGARRKDIFADESLDLSFQLLNFDSTVWKTLPHGFSAKLDVSSQYSNHRLPYSQRFSMGGGAFFYAYEAGEFSGDSGLGARLEVRRGIDTSFAALSRVVPYLYYGLATAYENASDSSESAAGAGAGLRLMSDVFSAFIEAGKPLTQDSEYKGNDFRVTGRISYYF